MTESNDIKRMQFDFSPKAVIRLEKLRNLLDVSSKAEVIRRALSFYEFFLEKHEEKYHLYLEKDNHKIQIEILQ